MDASQWVRRRSAPALSSIFVLQQAVEAGGVDPLALRAQIEASIVNMIQWDEEARECGFSAPLIQRVRLALIATADEITQRTGSRCDYSSPPPPNEPSLLQQKYFKAWKAGHTFFEELDATIKPPHMSPAERALLELFALCLSFGIRGKYEAHDIAGYEAMRARVSEKLRMEPMPGPPQPPAIAWPRPPTSGRWALWVAAVVIIFTATMLLTYRAELGHQARSLRDFLDGLQTSIPS